MQYLEPKFLIDTFGTIGVISIIFAESGLFFGFFFPGDSLLFTAGLFASLGYLSIVPLVLGSILASILGDSVGYAFGRRIGPALFQRPESRFFKPKHVDRANLFYATYGSKTIVLARFIPIVRTFAPIIAGVAGMTYKKFLSFNIWGGTGWVLLMTLSGFFLGSFFPGISQYLHVIIIVIIFLSILPILREWLKSRAR